MARSKESPSSRSEKARLAKEAKLEEQRKKREARGVVCIAFAVLLGVYLFVAHQGSLGEFLSNFLFGLFGLVAYALPVLTFIAGCMIIHGSKINNFGRADWMFALAGWAVTGLFHLARNTQYKGYSLGDYIKEAYDLGCNRLGGGAVGAVLCYPIRQFGGNALAYVVLITILVVTALLLTRISIKKMGDAVGRGVSGAYRTAQESVSRAVENRRPKEPKKLFIFKMVDREEEPEEEEFDNPFLPEKERKSKVDMEGFDSVADTISGKRRGRNARPEPEPEESEEDFSLFGVEDRTAIMNSTSSSPFNPTMATVAAFKKQDKERASSVNKTALPEPVQKPAAKPEPAPAIEITPDSVTVETTVITAPRRSRYNHVPAPQGTERKNREDIWSDIDIRPIDEGTEEEDWPFGDFASTEPGKTASYEVPAYIRRGNASSDSAPAPTSLKRPGIIKDRETFSAPYDGDYITGESGADEAVKPPVQKRRISANRPEPVDAAEPAGNGEAADDGEEILFRSVAQPANPVPVSVKKPSVSTGKTAPAAEAAEEGREEESFDINPEPSMPGYTPPPIDLLDPPQGNGSSTDDPEAASKLLVNTLQNFGISVRMLGYSIGPVITRFELQPAPGVRVSKITGLSNDIALALAAERVRIEAPIPGKSAVGIEVPNKHSVGVVLREIIETPEFKKSASPITLAFGKDIAGKVVTANLEKMPHLLIAGATGSGKSVCINDLILSMVYKSSPDDVRMILIDPKVVELKVYSELPHLLIPVVTDPKKAAGSLRWAVNEMMNRYKKFSDVGARNIQGYNATADPDKKYARLVVVIDELADLMMVAPDDVEDSICRIAQLGRAAGIHLIVATQRPSADIITGLIKANIPSRCAFAVSSGIDSRIILDEMGAEKLLGKGDMLFHPNGAGKPTRVQCAFVSDDEVERIMAYFQGSGTGAPNYDEQFINTVLNAATGGPTGGAFGEGKQEDDLFLDALGVVVENGSASISMIQRRLRVGYARAARLIDMMEQKGYVSGFDGAKPRRLLITKSGYQNLLSGGEPGADGMAPDDGGYDEEDEEQ